MILSLALELIYLRVICLNTFFVPTLFFVSFFITYLLNIKSFSKYQYIFIALYLFLTEFPLLNAFILYIIYILILNLKKYNKSFISFIIIYLVVFLTYNLLMFLLLVLYGYLKLDLNYFFYKFISLTLGSFIYSIISYFFFFLKKSNINFKKLNIINRDDLNEI